MIHRSPLTIAPGAACCCPTWPLCDCPMEPLDPDDPDDEDALFVIKGKAVTYDEFYKYHFDPAPRK